MRLRLFRIKGGAAAAGCLANFCVQTAKLTITAPE